MTHTSTEKKKKTTTEQVKYVPVDKKDTYWKTFKRSGIRTNYILYSQKRDRNATYEQLRFTSSFQPFFFLN